ncbi:MAG: carbohydrate binding family 9 domain-containing protein [Flammeovirgaceae bacterium]|nr:carbohydrate binding family 9 domain-containing protein [Flammeovirgaceae bacterium]
MVSDRNIFVILFKLTIDLIVRARMFRISFLSLVFSFLVIVVTAQDDKKLFIKRANTAIKIDGILNESDWLEADSAINFFQQFPFDSSRTVAQTMVKTTYDDRFIYVGAVCYSKDPSKFVIPSLRRDFFGQGIDLFAVIFDTYQDVTNAFTFGTNPAGVQREGLVAGGGTSFERGGVDFTWDNKWYNEVTITEDAWVVEMAIPFKSIRFKEGSKEWNINFYRQDSKENERGHWAGVPRNFMSFALNYHGKLVWDEPLKKPGANISVIPYVSDRVSRDFENSGETENQFNIGGDAKIAVTSALNLDITINPDFQM